MFVLVKGNLQGVSAKASQKAGNKKSQPVNGPPVCKAAFLNSFRHIYSKLSPPETDMASISYAKAKQLATEYEKASDAFYSAYKDWLRIDRQKYYNFS